MIAPPFVTWSTIRASGGFSASRLGPTVPVAPASLSVWQPAQPTVWKMCFPGDAAVAVVVVLVVGAAAGAGFAAVTPQLGLPAHFATYVAMSLASCPE